MSESECVLQTHLCVYKIDERKRMCFKGILDSLKIEFFKHT